MSATARISVHKLIFLSKSLSVSSVKKKHTHSEQYRVSDLR
jgi:hypothetical protein